MLRERKHMYGRLFCLCAQIYPEYAPQLLFSRGLCNFPLS